MIVMLLLVDVTLMRGYATVVDGCDSCNGD